MMMVTTGAEPPELPDGHWIVDHCFPKPILQQAGWSFGSKARNAKGEDRLHGKGVRHVRKICAQPGGGGEEPVTVDPESE